MTGDEFERDEIDRALAAEMADLAPGEPDATGALQALRPRMQRARTRHRVLQGSAAAALVLVLGIGVALAAPGDKRSQVQVSNPPTTQNNGDRVRGTSTTVPGENTTVRGTTPSTIAGTKIVTPGATTPAGGPTPTNPPSGSNVTPGTGAAPTTSPTIVAPDPGRDYQYSSDGGSLVVHFANGRLSLVSHTAVSGYSATVHQNNPDDIEVRFRKGNDEPRIRVRVIDGRVVPEIRN